MYSPLTIRASDINGKATVLPSKSITQRAIAAAVLTKGDTTIINPSYASDTIAALDIAQCLGAAVQFTTNGICISGNFHAKSPQINCGESGLAMRMFAPIAALISDTIVLNGLGSLVKRPMSMVKKALEQSTVFVKLSEEDLPPLVIYGKLLGGDFLLDGSQTSQLLTGMLMALPLVSDDSTITVSQMNSKPYIDLTIDVLQEFGVNVKNSNYQLFTIKGNQEYQRSVSLKVESDWGAAAFLLVAAAINGDIELEDINTHSKQADIAILKVLETVQAGFQITDSTVRVWNKPLSAFEFDTSQCPDLFPALAALAVHCNGTSIITGVDRLRNKESDRAFAIQSILNLLGVRAKILGNDMHIVGGQVVGDYQTVDSFNDHRIAMMIALLALKSKGPITLGNSACVKKSFPDFFSEMQQLGLRIRTKY